MACGEPLRGYRTPEGKIKIIARGAYYDLPTVPIACGQCKLCRLTRAHQWALRCMHEVQSYSERGLGSCFVTLTYDADHLPRDLGLHVEHWQEFARYVRRSYRDFRYLHCGEYGETNQRPHYHALMFGVDFAEDRIPVGVNEFGDKHYLSPRLRGLWGRGHVLVGNVSWKSAAYVARYCMKKVTGDRAAEHYQRFNSETGEVWNVRPEYCTMSRRPGLGTEWFLKYAGDVFPSDEVIFEGKRVKTPKFYDKFLSEKDLEELKARRVARGKLYKEALAPERLAAREYIVSNTLKVRR